ncbi:hypothetical protein [Bathymodiolus thermophilus thioautotrophic gill symbiont]|uniref:Uncharacterized protein n=1 Tax=Bathymodiolus thermophilus thioautotrophic gill symbiont TaxID=2360 RepID=A0A8H9CFC3_9GAMM|nr:hypothetical protein [Bathymodiolus thermophilus thioautotrophic gill symbiont]CAB5498063.1 hypothetical protein THERMOS_777 [Bathymodiolus thermophilus thioautotrophic gill symbiont]
MKFKNIFFGFLKTLLLIVVFCSSLLYADGLMFLNLQNYQPANNLPPYFFEVEPVTGNLIKVFDIENDFQFKTYNFRVTADMESCIKEVEPVLLEWREEIEPFDEEFHSSSSLSDAMLIDLRHDFGDGPFSGEVHVATYEGRIEAISYVPKAEAVVPEIDTIVANPWGMIEGQTTNVKGAGSSLLDYILQKFRSRGAVKARLYSVRDQYYLDRGWQRESDDYSACGR